jgi:adenylate kinase
VHVSARGLIKEEVARKPELAKVITAAMNDGKLVPESIIIPLVEQRLKQSDCRVNGWVLEGFPQNEAQINLLRSLKITPSLVCMFE